MTKLNETLEKLLGKDKILMARWSAFKDKAKNNWLRDLGKNGLDHSRKVEEYLDRLITDEVKKQMTTGEIFVLLCATYLHDIGRLKAQKKGHEKAGYDEICLNFQKYDFDNSFEAKVVAEVSYAHASEKEKPISSLKARGVDSLHPKTIDLQFLGALLRLADEIDNPFTRVIGFSDQADSFRHLIGFVNIDTERWIIEFQHDASSESAKKMLAEAVESAQKRLDEVKDIINRRGLKFWKVVANPPVLPTRWLGYFDTNEELEEFYSLNKTFEMAKKGERIYVVGRSLKRWTNSKKLVEKAMKEKGIEFRMLFLDPKTDLSLMDETEQQELRASVPESLKAFNELRKKSSLLSFRLTPNFILESITLFTKNNGEEIILFDIHTGDPNKKAIFEIKKPSKDDLLFTSLRNRALNLFEKGYEYLDENEIAGKISKIEQDEDINPDKLRSNDLESYIYHVPKVFRSIVENREALPPLCVEFEITNRCGSNCKMCERWKWKETPELSYHEIRKILSSLSYFGVKSIVLSGGEPTLRPDFIGILSWAKELNMHIGIFSDGTNISNETAKAIVEYADWVRISLDGSTEAIYEKVRGPGRFDRVVNSLNLLGTYRKSSLCKIGICYTIINENVNDFLGMVKFCQNREYIDFASFKFAHGADDFLCSRESIEGIKTAIDERKVYESKSMNLSYLKWLIERLGPENISMGKPTKSFYRQEQMRCFTPYLFSLIDASGGVYPCCHLYYDNSNDSERYARKRDEAKIGNLADYDFNFANIWKSKEYNKTRSQLSCISLEGMHEQCGDCTRHFPHNYMLTRLFNFYRKLCPTSQDYFEKYIINNKKDEIVWF
jgi:MoaA/NifB/PqqE/SkfB family radical SAM enzyme